VTLTGFDPFAPTVTACPYPQMAQLRAEAPVLWSEAANAFVVTRHDLIMEVVRDPGRFSSEFGRAGRPVPPEWRQRIDAVIAEGYPRVATLLTADPPAHTRSRRLVAKAFSPRAIAELEPTIRLICRRLIDSWVDGDELEFVERFAVPLPVEVIARALNVPDSDLAQFKAWSDATTAAIGTDITIEELETSERSINEFQRYFAEQLERRREVPQDDILTHLLQARIDDDDPEVTDRRPLDMAEMLRILQQLLVAGNETTTSLLSDVMVMLGNHPDEWRRLRHESSRIPKVVEEALRLASPSSAIWRIATSDTHLDGVAIPEGSRLIITWMSANRDERVFGETADQFDPDRQRLQDHIAFGFGVHYCIGAPLSRLETRVALEELTARIESFTLSDHNQYRYHPSFFLRAMTDLSIVPRLAG
jgi:cytochrome P450